MAFSDMMTGLLFQSNNWDGNFSDRDDSDDDHQDEDSPGLIQSIFGFWGFGSKKKNAKEPSISKNKSDLDKLQKQEIQEITKPYKVSFYCNSKIIISLL